MQVIQVRVSETCLGHDEGRGAAANAVQSAEGSGKRWYLREPKSRMTLRHLGQAEES